MEITDFRGYCCFGDAVLMRSPSDEQKDCILRAVMYTKLRADDEAQSQPFDTRLSRQLDAFGELFWNIRKSNVHEYTHAQQQALPMSELAHQAIDWYLPVNARAAARELASSVLAHDVKLGKQSPSEFVTVLVNAKRSAYLVAVHVHTEDVSSKTLADEAPRVSTRFIFRQFEILPTFWDVSGQLAEYVDEYFTEHVVQLPEPG